MPISPLYKPLLDDPAQAPGVLHAAAELSVRTGALVHRLGVVRADDEGAAT
jgi:hypothetical protein